MKKERKKKKRLLTDAVAEEDQQSNKRSKPSKDAQKQVSFFVSPKSKNFLTLCSEETFPWRNGIILLACLNAENATCFVSNMDIKRFVINNILSKRLPFSGFNFRRTGEKAEKVDKENRRKGCKRTQETSEEVKKSPDW